MTSLYVLNENWSDYDERKKQYGDTRYFSCTESWEVNFLVDKIHHTHPAYSNEMILAAIRACGNILGAPYPRPAFIQCVLKRLEYS